MRNVLHFFVFFISLNSFAIELKSVELFQDYYRLEPGSVILHYVGFKQSIAGKITIRELEYEHAYVEQTKGKSHLGVFPESQVFSNTSDLLDWARQKYCTPDYTKSAPFRVVVYADADRKMRIGSAPIKTKLGFEMPSKLKPNSPARMYLTISSKGQQPNPNHPPLEVICNSASPVYEDFWTW